MKSIFIVNTVYQLFIVVNMRLHNIPEGPVDIAISDHTDVLKTYLNNLKESNLFENVFYIESRNFCYEGFWALTKSERIHACRNSEDTLRKIPSCPMVNYNKYDKLFAANIDCYTKFAFMTNNKMDFYAFEDGGSVCFYNSKQSHQHLNYLPEFDSVFMNRKNLFLYTPDLMMYNPGCPMTVLPPVDKNNSQTVEIYNKIFNYDPSFKFPPFVFIEQSFQVDNVINNDLEFMQAAFEIVGYDNLYIKRHPRNTLDRPFQHGFAKKDCINVPFELMLLNCDAENSVFISVNSGSVISPRVIFKQDIKTILLYKAITGEINSASSKDFNKYLDEFVNKYKSKNLMIPTNMDEYKMILRYLASQ